MHIRCKTGYTHIYVVTHSAVELPLAHVPVLYKPSGQSAPLTILWGFRGDSSLLQLETSVKYKHSKPPPVVE